MAELQLDRPDERLTIKFKGQDKELFMSFKRINNLLRVLGEPNMLPALMVDPDLMEDSMRVMLAATPTTSIADVEMGEEDITSDDADRMLTWIQANLAYFFMMRFQKINEQNRALGPAAEALKSSLLGSVGSTSSEAVAGPST